MTRQQRQTNVTSANELINFRFSTPSSSSLSSPLSPTPLSPAPLRGHTNRTRATRARPQQPPQPQNHPRLSSHSQPSTRRNKLDWTSARRNASVKFFELHASTDHSFVLTRRSPHPSIAGKVDATEQCTFTRHHADNNNSNNNVVSLATSCSFQGPDAPVSWDAVRLVLYRVSGDDEYTCPICLDSYTCPRITKCGHIFCLACLLRHVHTHWQDGVTISTPPAHTHNTIQLSQVKCPCCSLPLHCGDVRPVSLFAVVRPIVHQHVRLLKLHRQKQCSAPYLPLLHAPRRQSPSAAPTYGKDPDAPFCRWNYVDPEHLQRFLFNNLELLVTQRNNSPPNPSPRGPPRNNGQLARPQTPGSNAARTAALHASVNATAEALFRDLAIEHIRHELQEAINDRSEEESMIERFAKQSAGFYQTHPAPLLAREYESRQFDHANTNGEIVVKQASLLRAPSGLDHCSCPAATATLVGQHDPHDDIEWTDSLRSAIDETKTMLDSPDSDIDGIRTQFSTTSNSSNGLRFRGDSTCSDVACPSTPSVGGGHRSRVDSVSSSDLRNHKSSASYHGTMYSDVEEECVFYQAEDGSLCFLSSFNMNCLRSNFSLGLPPESLDGGSSTTTQWNSPRHLPLPDALEGKILDIERVILTPELRQRVRFLSHLPLYTEICFLEVGIGHVLSGETKKQFRKEFQKRKLARNSRISAELRADEKLREREESLIHERKSRQQHIHPDDVFFQISTSPSSGNSPIFLGDTFGPTVANISQHNAASTHDVPSAAVGTDSDKPAVLSFSAIARVRDPFPVLGSVTREMDFPLLGASTQTASLRAKPSGTWGMPRNSDNLPGPKPLKTDNHSSGNSIEQAQPTRGSGKGKKVVLFSTGALRKTYN